MVEAEQAAFGCVADCGYFQRLAVGQGWQQPGQPTSQHGLTYAGWAVEQQMMTTRCSDF